MNSILNQIKSEVYDKCTFEISEFKSELESKEYDACRYKLNGSNIINRSAKITPKKNGQFVTFWKRNENEPIAPFDENDNCDFFVVNVINENRFGQFVFPKKKLILKGIISTQKKEGKRAFRVYSKWDIPNNKTAEKTQKWQLDYFYEINKSTDFKKVVELYKTN
jgi:hypothetical protein